MRWKETQLLLWSILFVFLSCLSHAEQKLYFVHSDHLDTPQALTNENQEVVWRADYTPFGEATVDEDPDGDGTAVEFNLRFPGQYYDKETDTNYNYYRTYDPKLGRYIQSDPIGLAGGINTYGYVYQNPIKYTDPDGLIAIPIPTPLIRPIPFPTFQDPVLPIPLPLDDGDSRPERGRGLCKLKSSVYLGENEEGRYFMLCTYVCSDGSSVTTTYPQKYKKCPDYYYDDLAKPIEPNQCPSE